MTSGLQRRVAALFSWRKEVNKLDLVNYACVTFVLAKALYVMRVEILKEGFVVLPFISEVVLA